MSLSLLFVVLDLAATIAAPPPTSSSVELAVRELERADSYVGYVGPTLKRGETLQQLAVVTALGVNATPYLLRLARSRNPVARAAAADGFAEVPSAKGRRALRRLLRDHAKFELLSGCVGELRQVSEFVREALSARQNEGR